MSVTPHTPAKIIILFGVYDADASIWGEMTYWIGARLGVRHCSLCDITHSLFREKENWKECQAELAAKYGVEFRAFHRDDQPDSVRNVINGAYPAVVAQDEVGKYSLFMSSSEISSCGVLPMSLLGAIKSRLSET
ncbi:MAG: hypothetical protein CK552_05130 [Actinobacteria bacterium]|nr:MAG: hypothetical protein CK552_05130 [Actinomycetota bacterium]